MKQFNFSGQEKLIFNRFGISAVVLFGSQALGIARDTSDFDFGILVNNQTILDTDKRKKIYDSLYDLLSDKVGEIKDIDIVFLQTAPAELQMHAVKKAKVLYEEKAGVFANFKARIILEYADFAPFREMFHASVLSRIK